MNHILPYDAINEAATALPQMPDFLKKAGAKPDYVQYGGPRNVGNPPPNVWMLEVKVPYATSGTWDLVFWPDGTFETHIAPENTKGPFETTGTWKTDPAAKFSIGKVTLNGVVIKITSLMYPTTYM
jgi:hypothetical protein